MWHPFLFEPIFQERIWGGRALETLYHKRIPAGAAIGESWEISDRPEAQSTIANGPLAGRTLAWLMQNHRAELLGQARPLGGRFPLLVKILDAREKLSLQVHPPKSVAAEVGGEPKTELWFIAAAGPGAELYVGLRRGITRREFGERIADGTVAECFHRVAVQAGDAMFLPSGRVHAIGGGLVIFEIQQNSDTTYRVFDWNRVDAQGRPRKLHLAESLASIDFGDFEPPILRPQSKSGVETLVTDELFEVSLASLGRLETLAVPLRSCRIAAAVEGTVEIPAHGISLAAGQFCLCPAALGEVEFRGATKARLLLAEPG